MTDPRNPGERKTPPSTPGELRQNAEEHLSELCAAPTPEMGDVTAVLHELRVHQIELEMQNTELRCAQLELDSQREKYFEFFDRAPVGYITLRARGIIGDANLTAAHLLGVERQLLVGQPFSAFVFAPDRRAYYRHQAALRKTGEPQIDELRLQRIMHGADVDPSQFWAHLESRPESAIGDAAPLDWVTFTDIDRRKRAEEALHVREQSIRQAYIDVLGAVTGGRLMLMWPGELIAALGEVVVQATPISKLEDLAEVRHRLADILQRITPNRVDDEVLAINEGLTNALKHGGHAEYSIRLTPDRVQFVVTDFGPGIDFSTLPNATLVAGFSTKPSLGLGFTIMLELTERLLLATEPGLTTLVLEFELKGASQ